MKRFAIIGFLFLLLATTAQAAWTGPLTGLVDTNGNAIGSGNPLPITGSFSATVTGFAPNGNFSSPLSVSNATSNVALPAGAVVVVSNTGTATAFVSLGANNSVTATTNDIPIPGNSAVPLTVGSNTYLAAITSSSTTTLNLAGGAGIFTGFGGGGSGGSGGTVTANQGGTWNITNISGTISLPTGAATAANQAAVIGSESGGTAAANSELAGGVYNSSAPTLTNGQQVAIQLDSSGNQKVNVAAGTVAATQSGSWSVTVVQPTAANLNATVTGTVAATQSGTWTVQPGNTPNSTAWLVTGTGGTFPATESGTWNITNISGTVSLPTGAATATNQTSVIGSESGGTAAASSELAGGVYNSSGPILTTGQQVALQLDVNGNQKVNVAAGTVAATQSGTWTVQPGNTPNSTAWLVTGTGGTFPATESGTWNITNISGTISLPTGAATAANQTSVIGSESGGTAAASSELAGGVYNSSAPTLTNGQQAAVQLDSSGNTKVNVAAGAVAATQSGTWNITNVSGTISLPTGAATAANQTNASQKTQIVDGSGNVIASTSNNLNVQCANCSGSGVSTADEATFTAGTSLFAGSGGFFQTTATTNPLTTGKQGMVQMTAQRAFFINLRDSSGNEEGLSGQPLQVTGANGTFPATESGTWNITNISGTISLPTGAATAANQTSVIGSESGGTAAANSELAGGVYNSSAPTLTTGQQAAIQLDASGNQKVNVAAGTVAATQSGTWTVQPGNTPNSTAWLVTGTGGTFPATESGTWNITNISGTISLPTGAATATNQTNVIGSAGGGTAAADSELAGGIYNSSAPTLTNGQQAAIQLDTSGNQKVNVAAGTVAATQSGTWNITNVSGTISLPTGAATASNQTVVIGSVSGGTAAADSELMGGVYNSSAPTLTNGQQAAVQFDSNGNTKVNVAAGTVAATQSGTWTVQPGNTPNSTAWLVTGTGGTFPATESGTWNITNISGTVSLPTGAATSANQTNASQKTQIVDGSGNVIASTSNNLNVQCANCSGSGVSTGDEASFTAGASLFAGSGGFYQTTTTSNPLTTGQQGMHQLTQYRAEMVNLVGSNGAEEGTTAAPLQTTGANGLFPVTQSSTWNITNITGTITLPTGAASATNQTNVIGSASGGTAAVDSELTGGVYNSSAPTLTTGQQASVQLDSAGNLKVNVAAQGTITVQPGNTPNSTAWLVTGTGGTFPATESGTWNITNISGTISLPTGAATSANQTNASQKTQIVDGSGNVIASTSNNLNVQCANCSGSGVSTSDEASFTAGTSLFAGAGGFFQTTATTHPLTTGEQGMVQMTATRAMFMNLRDSSGNEEGLSGQPLQVIIASGTTAATQSGTWTVQPGNTPNSTAWLVTGTGGTFPATESGTWNITNISGTVSLPTGAATATNQTNVIGSESGGTAATDSELVGGVYNSSAPTLTTGQQAAIQLDSSGNQKVNVATGTVAATQSGTWTVQPGNTANSTAWLVTGTGGTFPATESGTWNITNISGTVSLPTGAATATNQTNVIGSESGGTAAVDSELVGGVYNSSAPTLTNGQQAAIQFDSSGNTKVNVAAGTVAATQSGTWNITNVSGTISLPTGAATATNQTNVIGSESGGTAAADSELTGGVYNSSAPTLTNGQQAAVQFDSSGNTKVNVAAGTVAATQSGTWNITNISGTISLPTGAATATNQTNVIGSAGGGTAAADSELTGGVYNSSAPTLTNGQQAAVQFDSSGNTKVNVAAGTVAATESGTWTVQPGNTPNSTAWLTTQTPGTAGGLSILSNIVANNTTSVAIKSSAGQLFGIQAFSISAATPAYIKLYNTAQGSTTCGSGTPVGRYQIPAPGGASGSGMIWDDVNGVAFGTAITYCVTAAIGDADTTAPAASTYIVNFLYK